MARQTDDLRGGGGPAATLPDVPAGHKILTATAGEQALTLPDPALVRDGHFTRDGQDLVITGPDGQTVIVEGYFNAMPPPVLDAEGGLRLTPAMVQAFLGHDGPIQVAAAGTQNDASPIGVAQNVSGTATVTRTDGTTEPLAPGTPIFQGDIVETAGDGAVNIVFADESRFAVSQNARLSIDEYIFDPATESGASGFSMLRGLFVFTSGLIGRGDPDDVSIETPMGSIGIRGTIIAGDIQTGTITVVEGAIVLRAHNGEEMTLAAQFDTARFHPDGSGIEFLGTAGAPEMRDNFSPLNSVAPEFFSGIGYGGPAAPGLPGAGPAPEQQQQPPQQQSPQQPEPPAAPDMGRTDFRGQDNSFRGGDNPFGDTPPSPSPAPPGGTGGGAQGPAPGTTTGQDGPSGSGNAPGSGSKAPPPQEIPDPSIFGGNDKPPGGPPPLPFRIDIESIDEDAPPGTLVATIRLDGAFQEITYALADDRGGTLRLETAPSGTEAYIYLASIADLTDVTSLTFTVTATADGRTGNVTRNVTVAAVNHGPSASDDAFASDEYDGIADRNVFADNGFGEDTDEDGDTIRVVNVGDGTGGVGLPQEGSAGGTFTIDEDGNIAFDPGDDFLDLARDETRTTTIRYTIQDPGGLTATATVTVTVTGSDDTLAFRSEKSFTGTSRAETVILTGDLNIIDTGDGADSITIGVNARENQVRAGAGADIIIINGDRNEVDGDDGNDTITVNGNENTVHGGDGKDTITVNGNGNTTIDGGDGSDTITVSGNENTIHGGQGNDTISVSGNENVIDGGDSTIDLSDNAGRGNDIVLSGDKNEYTGGSGRDTATVSGNDNTLDLATGDNVATVLGAGNTILSGDGNDSFTIEDDAERNGVTDSGGVNSITIKGQENTVSSGDGADTVEIKGANARENIVETGDGDDTITLGTNEAAARESGNTIRAGAGEDTIIIHASAGEDNNIDGGDGDDTFQLSLGSLPARLSLSGGAGDRDMLSFTGAGTLTFTPDGGLALSGIEEINAVDSQAQNLNLTLDAAFMQGLGNDHTLTLRIDGSDKLSLDITGLGFTLDSGTAGMKTYKNEDGHTIVIHYVDEADVLVTGAGGDGDPEPGGGGMLLLSALTDEDGFMIRGDQESMLAFSLAGIGDTDRDGFDDIAITRNTSADGAAYIVEGDESRGTIIESVYGGRVDDGLLENNVEGMIVAAGGDFNGDGYADYIVSAPGAQGGAGMIQVVSGYRDPSGPADIILTINGVTNGRAGSSIAGNIDLNRDGYADILIGAPGTGEGKAIVILGGAGTENFINLDSPPDALRIISQSEDNSTLIGASSLALSGTGKAYVLDEGKIVFYDIVNGIIEYERVLIDSDLEGARDMAAFGNTIFVTDEDEVTDEGKLLVFYRAGDTIARNEITLDDPSRIIVRGEKVYVLNNAAVSSLVNQGEIRIYDAKNPADITEAALTIVISNETPIDMAISDNRIFVVSQQEGSRSLHIFDLDGTPLLDPPFSMSSLGLPDIIDMAATDTHLYLATANGIMIVTGSSIVEEEISGVSALDIRGDTLYVTRTDAGRGIIEAYDISEGTLPPEPRQFDSGGLTNIKDIIIGDDGHIYAIRHDTLFSLTEKPLFTTIGGAGTVEMVASAGDFNNDGYDDIMLLHNDGKVHIYAGHPELASAPPVQIGTAIDAGDTDMTLAKISLFSIGDLNGDGISDIAVGYMGTTSLNIYYGSAGADTMADISIQSTPETRLIRAGSVGDFNGDGIDDLALAYGSSDGGKDIDIYILHGSAGLSGTVTQDDFNAANSFHIRYTMPDDADPENFRVGLASAGDVNGDGFDDLAISFPDVNTTEEGSPADGIAAIIYGRTEDEDSYVIGSGPLSAGVNGQHLVGSASDDTLDAQGYQQLSLRGGGGDDEFRITGRSSFSHIDGGAGIADTLFASEALDLSGINRETISRIEKIRMGNDAESLTIALNGIYNLLSTSDSGRLDIDVSNTDTTLTIRGTAETRAEASAEDIAMALGARLDSTGNQYEFTMGNYTLALDMNLVDSGNVTLNAGGAIGS